MSARILVVDDEPDICASVQTILTDEGFDVVTAESGSEAEAELNKAPVDLVLLDIWMQPQDGINLLRQWKKEQLAQVPVMMMSGHGTVETAVEATRLGAHGFIEKPLTIAKLLQAVNSCLRQTAPAGIHLRHAREFAGSSQAIKDLRADIEASAHTDQHTLIVGAVGSGCRLVAESIHYQSARQAQPFYSRGMPVEQGAEIRSGTILLDALQLKPEEFSQQLLAGMEQTSKSPIVMAVIVSATMYATPTAALRQFVEKFNPRCIQVPALKVYRQDMPEVIRASVDWHTQNNTQLTWRKFSIAAQNDLLQNDKPETLADLDEMVERLLASGGDEVALEEVRALTSEHQPGTENVFQGLLNQPLRTARREFERIYFQQLLEQADGSISRLAEKAGMERTHVYRKLRALGITYKGGGG